MIDHQIGIHTAAPAELLPISGIRRPDAIHLDRQQTQEFLQHVAHHPQGRVHRKEMLNGLFESVANYMRGWISLERQGILVSDGLCSGRITSGLVAQRDASTFVVGAVNVSVPGPLLFTGDDQRPVSFVTQDQRGMARNVFLGPFGKIVNLPADLILGINGDIASRCCDVHISMRGQTTAFNRFTIPTYSGPHLNRPDSSLASWRYYQTMAALCGLHQLQIWFRLNNVPNKPAILKASELSIPVGRLLNRSSLGQQSLPAKIPTTTEAIRRESDKVWRESVFPLLERLDLRGISMAESFTGGALAALVHSIPGVTRRTDHEIVWYNEPTKRAFGVQQAMLTDTAIVDPRTMTSGGIALIEASPDTTTAITTSGWTNLTGKPDKFSVAVVNKIPGYFRIVRAQVVIKDSANWPSSAERKAFAREAGVAVSLLTFSRLLIGRLPRDERHRFAAQTLKLHSLLEENIEMVQEVVKLPIAKPSVRVDKDALSVGGSGEPAQPSVDSSEPNS